MKLRNILSAFAIIMTVAGCGQSNKKAEEQAAAEQAMLDSLKAAEQVKKEQDAMTKLATLPEEPVFDITTKLKWQTEIQEKRNNRNIE